MNITDITWEISKRLLHRRIPHEEDGHVVWLPLKRDKLSVLRVECDGEGARVWLRHDADTGDLFGPMTPVFEESVERVESRWLDDVADRIVKHVDSVNKESPA
jgi:hypothetical protein